MMHGEENRKAHCIAHKKSGTVVCTGRTAKEKEERGSQRRKREQENDVKVCAILVNVEQKQPKACFSPYISGVVEESLFLHI